MPLKYSNLVNINLERHLSSVDYDIENRDTAALVVFDYNESTDEIVTEQLTSKLSAESIFNNLKIYYKNIYNSDLYKKVITSAADNREEISYEVITAYNPNITEYYYKNSSSEYKLIETDYITNATNIFFDNNGVNLTIYKVKKLNGSATNTDKVKEFINICNTIIPTNTIVVATNLSNENIKSALSNNDDNFKGLNLNDGAYKKLIVSNIIKSDSKSYDELISEYSNVDNLAFQYGIDGSEMAIAAYLTNIKINKVNSISDYCYTKLELPDQCILDNNDDIVNLYNLHVNVAIKLINDIRNYGGNLVIGEDLVNRYMLITLYQTLSIRLINVLKNKIKYNSDGINKISSAITAELDRYVENGYLTQDKIWTDENLVYNGYTLISKNTPIQNGYKFLILPLSSLSDEDKKLRKLPEIYILIADSIGIRTISITGEIY